MKKLFIFTFLFIFAVQNIGFAAVSSSKTRRFSPAPQKPSISQTAPSSGYKPSAPADSYKQTAPTGKTTNPSTAQPPANNGFMRGLGLFGGGMLLGSLFGNSLGFGSSGLFASLIGLFFNILIIGGILMAGRFLWGKFRHRQQDNRR